MFRKNKRKSSRIRENSNENIKNDSKCKEKGNQYKSWNPFRFNENIALKKRFFI